MSSYDNQKEDYGQLIGGGNSVELRNSVKLWLRWRRLSVKEGGMQPAIDYCDFLLVVSLDRRGMLWVE